MNTELTYGIGQYSMDKKYNLWDWIELISVALLVLYFFLRFAERAPDDGWLIAVSCILVALLLLKVLRLVVGLISKKPHSN